jgi:hypothetical protein
MKARFKDPVPHEAAKYIEELEALLAVEHQVDDGVSHERPCEVCDLLFGVSK